jgi:hypothetical protein
MLHTNRTAPPRCRRIPLAAALALALSLPAAASATQWVINSCVDDVASATTPGTLRYAVMHANDPTSLQLPDTIDMSGLTGGNACPSSKITLTQGALVISQQSLIIAGPGASTLQIDGSGSPCGSYCDNRVLTHSGSGPLVVNDIGLTGGVVYHFGIGSFGGCVNSTGSIALNHADISNCTTTTTAGNQYAAAGSGLYAQKDLTMAYSTISGNLLSSNAIAKGGGAYVKGNATLDHSTISSNSVSGLHKAIGGGIFAVGTVSLIESSVSGNSLTSSSTVDGIAYGGGIYSKGKLTLSGSSVSANSAAGYYGAFGGGLVGLDDVGSSSSFVIGNSSTASGPDRSAEGGGVILLGDFSATETTIDGNQVSAFNALGGGLVAYKGISLVRSTISHNHSSASVGGIFGESASPATSTVNIQSSTISGNTADYLVGGAFFNSATVGLYNSTVAFNTAAIGHLGAPIPFDYYAPGLALTGVSTTMTVTLQSSILSNNTYGAPETEVDLSTAKTSSNMISFNLSPANNFVRIYHIDGTLPIDTLPDPQKITCPLLGNLRDNGGPTQTHALLSGSPAIDTGNNVLDLTYDQRGDGYLRESVIADIGAYEVDQTDIVFNSNLEGCAGP